MKNVFDPHTNLGVFMIVAIAIIVVLFMLFIAPEWLVQISMVGLPIVMTTGKHDFKKKDIVVAIIVAIIVLIFGAITWPK